MNTIDTEVVAQQVEEIGWLNAAKALLDRHRQEHGLDSPLVLVMSDHDETGDQWESSLITPSAKRSGYWQVSYFGAHGFTGDYQCPSKLIALRRAMNEGFKVLRPDLLKQLALTPAFLAGEGGQQKRRHHTEG